MRQVEPQNCVAGLQDSGVSLHIRLRSCMRLHVGILRAKELPGAVARQILDDIGELAATVVALARIALGIFVREHRAHSFQHSLANEILGGN